MAESDDDGSVFWNAVQVWARIIASFSAVLVTVWGLVVGALSIAKNELQSAAREFVGQDTSEQELMRLTAAVETLSGGLVSANLPKMAETVNELARVVYAAYPEQIVVIDAHRSGVVSASGGLDECGRGEVCHARYFLHRTPEGDACGAPALIGGRTYDINYIPTPTTDTRFAAGSEQRVGSAPEWRDIEFRVGAAAESGFAEFVLSLSYPCPGGVRTQIMPSLFFDLKGAKNE